MDIIKIYVSELLDVQIVCLHRFYNYARDIINITYLSARLDVQILCCILRDYYNGNA